MAGGKAKFRDEFPDEANKIDSDPNIPEFVRQEFWKHVERWDGSIEISRHVSRCCGTRQFKGQDVPIEPGECLGTAQPIEEMAIGFSNQLIPGSSIPPPTPDEARLMLSRVFHQFDNDIALAEFKTAFDGYYLRALSFGTNTRIFAFKNPENPENPVPDDEILTLFERLAIPDASPDDYIMVSFRPHGNARIKMPTALDANIWNLAVFQPGGMTKPEDEDGLPEVVTPPPQCRRVTKAPRKIT